VPFGSLCESMERIQTLPEVGRARSSRVVLLEALQMPLALKGEENR